MADREAIYKDLVTDEVEEVTASKYAVTTTPTNEAGIAKVYSKDVGGIAKMHAIDSDGTEIELGANTTSSTNLTSSGGNVAVDADLGPFYDLELTEATTELNNPTNLIEGQEFVIVIKQDATGSRALTFGTNWLKKDGLTSGVASAADTVTIMRGNAVNLPNGPGLRIYYTLDHEEESVGAPAAHASTHISGGGDEIDGDQLDIDWNPSNYTPDTAPTEATSVDHLTAHLAGIDTALATTATHASSHITGAGDEIDGDQLDIDFTPTNYTPTTSPTEATSLDHLTAHLAGIDNALAASGGAFAIDSTVQTTDATVTVLHTVATTTDNVTWIEGVIQGRDNTANEVAYYKFIALFDNNAGTVTQKGSTTVVDNYEDDATWAFDLNISGTNVQIRVTGDATNAVEWRVLGNSGTHG